jgi:hypothetical protein
LKLNTIIIDDFLDRPELVRNSALNLSYHNTGFYPGFRSDRADYDYEEYVKNKIESITPLRIKTFKQDSFRFQLCTNSDETWLHHDETGWAGVLYLTPNAPVNSGTGIYRHIPTQQFTGPANLDVRKENEWELITVIGNVYNRLAIYNGQLFHRSIVPGFGNSVETARLTQVFFFETDDK